MGRINGEGIEIVGDYSPKREWHFLRRVRDRYGIVMSRADVQKLKRDIVSGAAPLRGTAERGAKSFYARIQESLVPVVYSKEDDLLITALPNTAYKPEKHLSVQRQSLSAADAKAQVAANRARRHRKGDWKRQRDVWR